MHRNVCRIVPWLAFAVLAVVVVGCGQKEFDVTGQVKYNGAVIDKPGGQVIFIAPSGTQVVAPIGQDGTYKASKVPAGPNRVAVTYPNPALGGKPPAKPPKGQPIIPSSTQDLFLTPANYASADTSGLSVEVASGTVFNVDMTGPKLP